MQIKKGMLWIQIVIVTTILSCQNPSNVSDHPGAKDYPEGSFGYDLRFLQKQDSSLVVLKNEAGRSQLIASAKYQAKVFTTTAKGLDGQSFGWVHYKAFSGPPDAHMNGYGGENRLWLGPEGGKYSLFFKPGTKMVFDNWVTPAAVDTEAWEVVGRDSASVTMHKDMQLRNYAGTELSIAIGRKISLLDKEAITEQLSISADDSVWMVGYETDNIMTNIGKTDWTLQTGAPCIWILDMFNPSPSTVIVIPFHPEGKQQIATTDYFGKIPDDRIKYRDSVLLFKADGKSRGKLGLTALRAKGIAGSYDAESHILTILTCDLDPDARYLNQEWDTTKPVFSGDAQNAYNDGPLADGSQMGPFYEMESVSPVAMLKSGSSLSHRQCVFHFTGNEQALDGIVRKLLGLTIDDIKKTF